MISVWDNLGPNSAKILQTNICGRWTPVQSGLGVSKDHKVYIWQKFERLWPMFLTRRLMQRNFTGSPNHPSSTPSSSYFTAFRAESLTCHHFSWRFLSSQGKFRQIIPRRGFRHVWLALWNMLHSRFGPVNDNHGILCEGSQKPGMHKVCRNLRIDHYVINLSPFFMVVSLFSGEIPADNPASWV